jgi:uncharacterized LabA/DUF88 family protein
MPQGPGGVIILADLSLQILEPQTKRAIAFVDGQNLYHHAKAAFDVTHPNYDVLALTRKICQSNGWFFKAARFYTGTPELADDPKWHNFWAKKLLAIKRQGVHVYSRRLRYREKEITIEGKSHTITVGEEKGIDIRIALDCVSFALSNDLDVAVIFSQDQDMSEVVDEIKKIARLQRRWIKVACAYPTSLTASNRRGINGSDWIPFDESTYKSCIDHRDYR